MPADLPPPPSPIILYQTEVGRTRIQCRYDGETQWLTQVQITDFFQTSIPNINIHIKAIYAEGELADPATIKPHLMVRSASALPPSRAFLCCYLAAEAA